tara:strand:- start:271 stop:642 length:372 start_codon:yes stop_codon:yes gene_type:complete
MTKAKCTLDADTKECVIEFYDKYVNESICRGLHARNLHEWYQLLVLLGLTEYKMQLEDLDKENVIEQSHDFLFRICASQSSTLSIKTKRELANTITAQIEKSEILTRLQRRIDIYDHKKKEKK